MSGIRELSSPTWQPIETAPEGAHLPVVFGYWEEYPDEDDNWYSYWSVYLVIWVDGRWEDFGNDRCPVKACTHWAPLPEPPVSSGQNLADANSKSPIQAREE